MRCELGWLAEWAAPLPPAADLAARLTAAGLEAELREPDLLEFDLTPNRGDCLSVRGLAREAAALTEAAYREPPAPAGALDPRLPPPALGEVDAAGCPGYSLRRIDGLDPSARTPDWMAARLERAGVRGHAFLVDVTNYVMLELGQPLHAFDAARVAGAVSVRTARPGERLAALAGGELELAEDMLVIADETRALAAAGIVGGADSAVGAGTASVLLEAALFTPAAVAGRARRLKLHTESAHRFERGVEPGLALRALRRATALILEHAGGRASPIASRGRTGAPPAAPVRLRARRLHAALGYAPQTAEAARTLAALGCRVREETDGWVAAPPPWRYDLALEEDLVEEVARVLGYDRIPRAAPRPPPAWRRPERPWTARFWRCRARLAERGWSEAVTYSFTEERLERLFAPGAEPLRLRNPLAAEQAALRTTLCPSLLRAAQYNRNRRAPGVRLFEIARVYAPADGGGVDERWALAGVAAGAAYPAQWGAQARALDFYDVKGDLESLFGAQAPALSFAPAAHPALHPGQAARIALDGRPLGVVGALHPELEEEFGLADACLFELELEAWPEAPPARFAPWPEYPETERDLALLVHEDVTAAALEDCVRGLGVESLRTLAVFDVYRDPALGGNRKSVGLRLIFQSLSGTLCDAEVDGLVAGIVGELSERLGAELRE